MPNRLAKENSPYLLQHKDNPVDWFPWGDEAFARAREADKPIFLSVGYSSCHWCHVMEKECFEDAEVASVLNSSFVSIKVDREELPEVDEAYMTAVQLSSGRGGWPMSIFMTPDGDPFFGGTYIPKEDRQGHPGLMRIMSEIDRLWRTDRERIDNSAQEFATAIRSSREHEVSSAKLGTELLRDAVKAHEMDFDEDLGGFGKAPKFPPHTAIEFLLNFAISEVGGEAERQSAADMALFTLERMALGGIHDHVGGGFHRYSTDEQWLVPHFEKMLYDNALLLGNYARAAALCHEQIPELETLFSRVVERLVGWLKSEMTSPEGLFYSALDADSEGEEGRYYVWTKAELSAVLGDRALAFCDTYQVHEAGNYRDEASGVVTGANILHLIEPTADPLVQSLDKLAQVRSKRVRPGLDDKALIAWNALAIGALAEAAELETAERAAEAIFAFEKSFGQLPHQVVKGVASGVAYLEDYAYLIEALLTLAAVKHQFRAENAKITGRSPEDWQSEAVRLAQVVDDKFRAANGAYNSTAKEHFERFGPSQPIFDQPLPSANAVMARVWMELGQPKRASEVLHALSGWLERAPTATEALHLALLRLGDDLEAGTARQDVEVELESATLMAINFAAEGKLLVDIAPGLHINAAVVAESWMTPTVLQVEGLPFRAHYPESENGRYQGTLEIPFEIDLPDGIAQQEVEIIFTFQVCSESACQLPETRRFSAVVRAT